MINTIDRLLQGSIDMHLHNGPDPAQERRVDALQAARQAREVGMRAVVLKSHAYPTAPLAYICSQMVSGIDIIGSICLDFEIGGLNVHALEASAKLGAKMVWMPTTASTYDIFLKGRKEGISILDGQGKLLPVVGKILDIVNRYQMVLATGHLPVEEVFILVDEARRKGITKIVATHPVGRHPGAYFSVEKQRQIADKGAFVEYVFITTLPDDRHDPKGLVETIRAVGAERCIMSTDFGQAHNPTPVEGMRMMIAYMLRYGLSEKEVELMVKTNPATLLGLG